MSLCFIQIKLSAFLKYLFKKNYFPGHFYGFFIFSNLGNYTVKMPMGIFTVSPTLALQRMVERSMWPNDERPLNVGLQAVYHEGLAIGYPLTAGYYVFWKRKIAEEE